MFTLSKAQAETELVNIVLLAADPELQKEGKELPQSYLRALFGDMLEPETQIRAAHFHFKHALDFIYAKELPRFNRGHFFSSFSLGNKDNYIKENRRPLSYALSRMDNINHEAGLGGRILSALRMIGPVLSQENLDMSNKEYARMRDLIDTLTEDLGTHPLYRMSKKHSLKNSAEAAVMFYDLSELFLRTPYLNRSILW